ncbi:hypothetical protein [Pseudomarimonas salicorniae]|uniref:Right handed beta helix region n=1 Tax=Pseudomarimonas salicorniae TaxID=2933270 RepID=A0ABT0GK28_9GAMM|nr:hypothetical protein [Lysobacter sp. CAU 1642]MCK7594763.1 hypothetical protein [Lysobacter sp. CAU 1642]
MPAKPNIALVGLLGLAPVAAEAETYQVGPTRGHTSLTSLFNAVDLGPGDIVEVDGDGARYPGGIVMPEADGGAPGNPVVLRGLRSGGQRPIIEGGFNSIELRAHHVVFEGFEITGTTSPVSTFRCFFHHSHDVVIRDARIHGCPQHGVLGADQGSGSLTIEYSEIWDAGSGDRNHTIYMATDEVAFPGSVFRLQHSYVHSANGGNLIKSRAERNEIYHNWLEGGFYHELELIGPDPGGAPAGWSEALVREDSDIVGNVIVHTAEFSSILRFGGDGTGQSRGRYRFVHNTVVRRHPNNDTPTVFRLFHGIESLAAHNNVFHREGGSGLRIVREVEADWSFGSRIIGRNNHVDAGSTFLPAGFTGTVVGADPGFTAAAASDLVPTLDSPLRDAANADTQGPADYAVAGSLAVPTFQPQRQAPAPGGALTRVTAFLAADIGAMERADPGRIFGSGFETGEAP